MIPVSLKDIVGGLLIFTSVFDAAKYSIQALKISKAKSAKNMSRKFTNFAILNDLVKLLYGIVIMDLFIIGSSILALGCMFHLWWETYLWYPYRCRGLLGFKRPNIVLYLINSLLSNRIRKRL